MKWSSSFNCGIAIIDEQHKKLFELINNIYLHTNGNQELERYHFCTVIDEFIKYIRLHLATEEEILNAVKFPGYKEHIRSHKTFITTVLDIVDDYRAGRHHTLTTVFNYIKNWALSHISVMDKAYFDYFRKIAARMPDGRLIITKENILSNK